MKGFEVNVEELEAVVAPMTRYEFWLWQRDHGYVVHDDSYGCTH